jgi:hypothetical protein
LTSNSDCDGANGHGDPHGVKGKIPDAILQVFPQFNKG